MVGDLEEGEKLGVGFGLAIRGRGGRSRGGLRGSGGLRGGVSGRASLLFRLFLGGWQE